MGECRSSISRGLGRAGRGRRNGDPILCLWVAFICHCNRQGRPGIEKDTHLRMKGPGTVDSLARRLHSLRHRPPLPRPVVPGRIRLAPELDARLRSDDREVYPGRPARARRWGIRLWIRQAEPGEVDRSEGGARRRGPIEHFCWPRSNVSCGGRCGCRRPATDRRSRGALYCWRRNHLLLSKRKRMLDLG